MAFSFEIVLIILFSVIGGVLAVRLKQPAVLGLIIVGAIVGPSTLGWITDKSLLATTLEIGAVLLLFTIGIEFNLRRLITIGFKAVIIDTIKIGTVFLITYYASFLLGFSTLASVYIGILLSITSTVIVIKILEQKGLYKKDETLLLVSILVIEDIFGIFALTFFSGLNGSADLRPAGILTSLVFSLLILVLVYFVIQRVVRVIVRWLVKYSTEDTITFTSLGLCGLMSYIALLLGLSPSIGAFLAGNIVSSLPKSNTFQKAIHPFLLTFTSLFFFSVGTHVDFLAIASNIKAVIVLFLATAAAIFLSISFGSYIFANFNGRQAVFSGLAMIPIGEFSLLIASEAANVGLGTDLVSLIAGIILLSAIAMTLLIGKLERIYALVIRYLPTRVSEDMKITSKFVNTVSWTVIKDKVGSRRLSDEWNTIRNNATIVFVIAAVGFFIWRYFNVAMQGILSNNYLVYLLIIIGVAILYIPIKRIIKNLVHLNKDIFKFFIKISPKEVQFDTKIFRKIRILSLLFILLIIFPNLLLFFKLPQLYHIIVIVLFIFLVFNVYRASNLIHGVVHRHEGDFVKSNRKYIAVMKRKIKAAEKEVGHVDENKV